MVWYGMVWGTLSRDPLGDYISHYLKKITCAISFAVLMHYPRLLWKGKVGLVTGSHTEELLTQS